MSEDLNLKDITFDVPSDPTKNTGNFVRFYFESRSDQLGFSAVYVAGCHYEGKCECENYFFLR